MLQTMDQLKAGDLLSVEQVAVICDVAERTVRQWIQERRLASIKVMGGLIRIRKEDLVSVLNLGYRARSR
jgi:excisionase family DNA binding protein